MLRSGENEGETACRKQAVSRCRKNIELSIYQIPSPHTIPQIPLEFSLLTLQNDYIL